MFFLNLDLISVTIYFHLLTDKTRVPLLHSSVTVGYLHIEFATASFVDDGFEYDGRPYCFEPEYTDEELLERRMQKQREELSCAAAGRVDDVIPLDARVESPR